MNIQRFTFSSVPNQFYFVFIKITPEPFIRLILSTTPITHPDHHHHNPSPPYSQPTLWIRFAFAILWPLRSNTYTTPTHTTNGYSIASTAHSPHLDCNPLSHFPAILFACQKPIHCSVQSSVHLPKHIHSTYSTNPPPYHSAHPMDGGEYRYTAHWTASSNSGSQ